MGRTVVLDTSQPNHHGSINHGETGILKKGEVIITFDDGPIPQRTRPILDSLDRHCVKATFFAVGRMAMAYPDTLRDVVRRGHTLAGHTWSHANLGRTGLAGGRNEVERGFAALEAITGRPAASLFRFPYLSTSRVLLAELTKANVGSISVDVVSGDTDGYSAEKMLRVTMERLRARGNGILLFHDIKKETVRAVPMILDALAAEGYKVVHLKTHAQYDARPDLVAEYRRILDKRAPAVGSAGSSVASRTPSVALPVRRTVVAEGTGGDGSFFSFASANIASGGHERASLALDRDSRELPPTQPRTQAGDVARTEEGTVEASASSGNAQPGAGAQQSETSRVAALVPASLATADLPTRRQPRAVSAARALPASEPEPWIGSLPRRRPHTPGETSSGLKAVKPDEAADSMPAPTVAGGSDKPDTAVAPIATATAAKQAAGAVPDASNDMPVNGRKRPAIVLSSPTIHAAKPADEMPAEPLSQATAPTGAGPSVAPAPAGSSAGLSVGANAAPAAASSSTVPATAWAPARSAVAASTANPQGTQQAAAAQSPQGNAVPPSDQTHKPSDVTAAGPVTGAPKRPEVASGRGQAVPQGAGERVTTARRTPATLNAAQPRHAHRGTAATSTQPTTAPQIATTRAAKATAALRRKRAAALRRAALEAEQEQQRRAIEARRRAAAGQAPRPGTNAPTTQTSQAATATPAQTQAQPPAAAVSGGGQTQLQKIWQREPFRPR